MAPHSELLSIIKIQDGWLAECLKKVFNLLSSFLNPLWKFQIVIEIRESVRWRCLMVEVRSASVRVLDLWVIGYSSM